MSKINNTTVLLVCLVVLGWGSSLFFFSESNRLQNDCKGLFPAVKEAINYYNVVCAEDINMYKLERLFIQTQDLNMLIKKV